MTILKQEPKVITATEILQRTEKCKQEINKDYEKLCDEEILDPLIDYWFKVLSEAKTRESLESDDGN